MGHLLEKTYQILQKLIGLHRQLLDLVRMEREALESAEVKAIQEITYSKEVVINTIRQCESERIEQMAQYAAATKKSDVNLSLSQFIEWVQSSDLKSADRFRSVQNTLRILIDRISEQNKDNKGFVEKTLEHVHEMKKNVLQENSRGSEVYTQRGVKQANVSGSRLISKEA